VVVALFTLPQVILQFLSFTLQSQTLTLDYNEDESKGRATCDSGFDMKSSLRDYGFWTLLLLMVLLLFMAHRTSQLPSLFNETKVIYESALFSIVLLVLGLGIIVVTDDPETSPSVRYLVQVVWTLSIALNTSLRTMMPKLRMVWRDEKVVVSKLVSDHSRSVREEDERNSTKTVSSVGVSGMSSAYDSTVRDSGFHSSVDSSVAVVSDCDDNHNDNHDKLLGETHITTEDTEKIESSPSGSDEFGQPPTPSLSKPGNSERRPSKVLSRRHISNRTNRILVECGQPSSRRLLLKMVDLQEELSVINSRIMSGIAVSEEEWNTVRKFTNKLGSTFNDEVDFAWEIDSTDIPSREINVLGGVEEETEQDLGRHAMVRFQVEEANGNAAAPVEELSPDAADGV
jgi:hypothetical protein